MALSPKVLVVEDEGLVALALEMVLGDFGYTVSAVCATGAEALEAVRRDPPDMVLMDITLRGGMDGIETACRLKEQRSDLPVVYISGLTDAATRARAAATAPAAYLAKPYRCEGLRAALGAVCPPGHPGRGAGFPPPIPSFSVSTPSACPPAP